jgi:PAS domain S-box-containing protein
MEPNKSAEELKNAARLRQRAVQALEGKSVDLNDLSVAEVMNILHELQVHQAELDIQNDELRKTQMELEIARDLYTDLYDFAPAGYCTLNHKGMILEANETLAHLFGTERKALIHNPLSNFVSRDDQDEFYLFRQRAFDGHLSRNQVCKIRMVKSTGENLIARLEGMVVRKDPSHLRVMLSDITEQERLELWSADVARTNQDLIIANQAKTEFLAMMSHELRSPLNTMLLLSESLREGIYGEVSAPQAKRLETIQSSGTHLLKIINGILDYSKIEAHHLDLHPETVNVFILCFDAVQLVNQQANQKGITISISTDILSQTVSLDPYRLRQILVNLLDNAVKFTPENGKVGLEVTQEKGTHSFRFTVSDTGIGIPTNQIGRLFQPFTQLDSSLSRPYGGTGLGLATVYRLAELMGGSVGVDSQPGQGSHFWVNIPFEPVPDVNGQFSSLASSDETLDNGNPVENPLQDTASVHPKKGIILVVEDQIDNRNSLCDFLTAKGYRIVSAWNGAEAIERAKEFHPDIILMDIQMPVMDGLEAIRRLKAMPDFTQIPIIALTALVMPGDRDRCLEAGANEYLEKPFSLQKILKVLQNERL